MYNFTSVITLSDEIRQGSKRNVVLRAQVIKEDAQLVHGYTQIGGREDILDVPTERAELPPLSNRGVKEAEAEKHLLEFVPPVAGVEPRVLQLAKRAQQVGAHSFWRLVCHFNAVLENKGRKCCF